MSTDAMDCLKRCLSLAGDEIRRFCFMEHVEIETKDDDSLVTSADYASEAIILKTIRESFPNDDILSEEAGYQSLSREDGRWVWVVDPLDGTTNFANGYPFYCVSIARASYMTGKMQVELAGVYDPSRDKMYTAAKGRGAFCNDRPMQVRPDRPFAEAFLVTGFAYHKGDQLSQDIAKFLSVAQDCQSIRRDGAAALDLALVADGIYDAYWESGLKPWDVAAGALLVKEAGGMVENITSHPDQPFDPENDSIVCGARSVARSIKDKVS